MTTRDTGKQSPKCADVYRMNDRRCVERAARSVGFRDVELRFCESHPAYLMFHAVPFLAGVAWERTVNRFELLRPLRANILGRLR